MAKKSAVMNPSPGPKPGPSKVQKFHPVANIPSASKPTFKPTASAGKGGPKDSMRPTKESQGPVAMMTPVKPGKNQMNIVPR